MQSEVGVGSVFTVTLETGSLDGVRMLDPRSAATPSREEIVPDSANLQLPPARVLVVDDGAENVKLMSLVLRRAGLHVYGASNGRQALEMVVQNRFDIILMDIEMPIMDGFVAASAMRARGIMSPIIALTAHAMKGVEEKCRAAGFSGYESKPINMDHLLATIARELTGSSPIAAGESEQSQGITAIDEVPSESSDEEPALGSNTALRKTQVLPRLSRSHPRLISKLPAEDAEFQEIVREFVERLREKLREMETAWHARDFQTLARLANWLKGSGGTAGFDAFQEPSIRLELFATEHSTAGIIEILAELRDLTSRIELVEPAPGTQIPVAGLDGALTSR